VESTVSNVTYQSLALEFVSKIIEASGSDPIKMRTDADSMLIGFNSLTTKGYVPWVSDPLQILYLYNNLPDRYDAEWGSLPTPKAILNTLNQKLRNKLEV
jgi:hypothetical protein